MASSRGRNVHVIQTAKTFLSNTQIPTTDPIVYENRQVVGGIYPRSVTGQTVRTAAQVMLLFRHGIEYIIHTCDDIRLTSGKNFPGKHDEHFDVDVEHSESWPFDAVRKP